MYKNIQTELLFEIYRRFYVIHTINIANSFDINIRRVCSLTAVWDKHLSGGIVLLKYLPKPKNRSGITSNINFFLLIFLDSQIWFMNTIRFCLFHWLNYHRHMSEAHFMCKYVRYVCMLCYSIVYLYIVYSRQFLYVFVKRSQMEIVSAMPLPCLCARIVGPFHTGTQILALLHAFILRILFFYFSCMCIYPNVSMKALTYIVHTIYTRENVQLNMEKY